MSNPAGAEVRLDRQGRLWLHTGAAEMGQGSDTVLAQIAAQTLGWPAEQIELVRADTAHTLNAGASSASRQTFISGNAVLEASAKLAGMLRAEAASLLDVDQAEVVLDAQSARAGGRGVSLSVLAGRLEDRGAPARAQGHFDPATTSLDPATGQGSPYQTYAFAAQAALVQVDRDSGETRVRKVAAAHDVGRAVNPKAVESQIMGGVVMGVGYALMEEYEPKMTNLHQYHLPTMADAPEVIPIIVETDDPDGPYGAKGVGEPSLIPTAPAVAGGLAQALGTRLRAQPFSLERVMAALISKEEREA
jgi:CO/xanthine dehydrogenase Mo-binding subunit